MMLQLPDVGTYYHVLAENEQLKKDNESLRSQLKELTKRYDKDMKEAIKRLTTKEAELSSRLAIFEEKNINQSRENENLREEIRCLKKENKKLIEENKTLKEEVRQMKNENEKLNSRVETLEQEKNYRQLLDYVADLSRLYFYYETVSWNEISEKIAEYTADFRDGDIDECTYNQALGNLHPKLNGNDILVLRSIIKARNRPAHQEIRAVVDQQQFVNKLQSISWQGFTNDEKNVVMFMLSALQHQKLKRYKKKKILHTNQIIFTFSLNLPLRKLTNEKDYCSNNM